MTPHLLPEPTNRRRPARFSSLLAQPGRLVRALSVAAGLTGTAGATLAEPPAPTPASRPAGTSNSIVASSVLAAIDADPELRGVHLFVSVVDGVAVIGGPVTSAAISKRAELVVSRVPDIREVRNGCFVFTGSGQDPLTRAVAERMKEGANPSRPALAELPSMLASPQSPAWNAPGSGGVQNSNQIALNRTGNEVVVRKPDQPIGGGLGAPVAPGAGSLPVSDSGREGYTVAGRLTGLPAAGPSDILTSAGNVKKIETRFANLTLELRDGVLVIGGSSPRGTDAWDLAEKLRQIPGVSRVVITANSSR